MVPEGGGRKSQRGKKESRGLGAVAKIGQDQGEGEHEQKQAAWPRSSRPKRSCTRRKKALEDDFEVPDSEEDAQAEAGRDDDDGEWNGAEEEEEEEDDDEGGDDEEWNPSGDDQDIEGGSKTARGKASGKAMGKVAAAKGTPARVVGRYFVGGAPPSAEGRSRGRATARARAAVRPSKKRDKARASVVAAEDEEPHEVDDVSADDEGVVSSTSRGRGAGNDSDRAAEGSTSTGRSKRETGTAAAKKQRCVGEREKCV